MASGGKRKTTMAKLNRERRLLEKRLEKAARKTARKRAAAEPQPAADSVYGPADETLDPVEDTPASPEETLAPDRD
jgi:hypothetical protein